MDRYAVSVLWELDARSLDVVDVWFGRTVIKSKYKLYYELAQEIADGATDQHILENIPGSRFRVHVIDTAKQAYNI